MRCSHPLAHVRIIANRRVGWLVSEVRLNYKAAKGSLHLYLLLRLCQRSGAH